MKRIYWGILAALVLLLCVGPTALAQSGPEFKLGFKALADQIPDVVGQAVDVERSSPNGDSVQRTSAGLMVWRKADNWTAFTNGNRTWVSGPDGVQERGNDERFDWEKEPATPQANPQSPEAPSAATPSVIPAAPSVTPAAPSVTAAPAVVTPPAPPLPATLKVAIDRPFEGTHVGYRLQVTGWAVSTDAANRPWSGIEEFKAFLDGPEGSGKALSVQVNRVSRPDVGTALGNPAFSNSGFSLGFNQAEVPAGRHTLYLYLRSATSGWSWKPIAFIAGYDGNWTPYDRSADGFQLSLPPGWAAVDLTAGDLLGQFRRVFKDNPEVRSNLSSVALGASFLRLMGGLFVAVPSAEASNSDVLATHAKLVAPLIDAPRTLDEAAQLFADQLNSLARVGAVKSLSQRRVSLPAADVVEFTYFQTAPGTSGSPVTLGVVDYAILYDGTLYELVFTCPSERFEQYRPLFDRMARSLQFVEPVDPGLSVGSPGDAGLVPMLAQAR